MISIENLSKSYGNKIVLENINLKLKRGKVYGIVGENGAGKTTLFNCISGLEKYNGTINCEYKNIKESLGICKLNPIIFQK